MEFSEVLASRHSTRLYTQAQISEEELAFLLKTANSSPVGSGLYKDVHLTVVQDPDVLTALSEAAEQRMQDRRKVARIVGDKPTGEGERGYSPFYHAPTVIFVSHRKQDLQPGIEWANAACVTLAMHLAATDLGLQSVFSWFALESMRLNPELDRTELLGLPEGFVPLMGLSVGRGRKKKAVRELPTDRISFNRL